ncbi:MAG: PKD domain-containing protein [Chloroflexaceae bacterium]|nr:PKD domain-containing protein [Chloroflexaceae bacterium]
MYGMVIRDPWYDFGSIPAAPNAPNYAAQDLMGAMLEQLGVQWVRMEFHIEGSDLTIAEQIARNDYFIYEVAPRHNLKILGLLGYGLVRGQDPRILGQVSFEVDPQYGPGIDQAKRIWLDRAQFVINRYGDAVAAYQVLNEPNRLATEWNAALPPSEVARLQTVLYRAVRHPTTANDSNDAAWRSTVQLVLSGIQPAGSGQINQFGHLSDADYIRRLYTAAPFQDYFAEHGRFPLDGLGYHPYPLEVYRSTIPITAPDTLTSAMIATYEQDLQQILATPDPQRDIAIITQRLDSIRAVLEEVGDPVQPFWITELGFNVAYGNQDATMQATFMQELASQIAPRPDVARVFWFKYEDFPPADGPDAQQWGVVRIPFEPGGCAGGACYDIAGRPALLRPAFFVYREQSGAAARLPEPPAQVTIWGEPGGALVYEPTTLYATVERTSVAQPITYTWQINDEPPIVHTGGLTDSLTLHWSRPGTYHLTLEARNTSGPVISSRVLRVYPCRCWPPLRRV